MALPFALFIDRPWMQPMPGMAAWTAIASAGVFCTAGAYALYFRILATAGATNLLLVTLLIPVGAMFLGMAVLGEQIHVCIVFGMVLIGLGLLATDGRLSTLFSLRPLSAATDD
jgi:drug/metabolite transporter (DMT)-like permease